MASDNHESVVGRFPSGTQMKTDQRLSPACEAFIKKARESGGKFMLGIWLVGQDGKPDDVMDFQVHRGAGFNYDLLLRALWHLKSHILESSPPGQKKIEQPSE